MTTWPDLPAGPFGLRRILRFAVSQVRRESLSVERILRASRCQHIFELPWAPLTETQRSDLDAFFQAVRGRILGDIAYTDPWDDTLYTCRLDQDELAASEILGTQFIWNCSLRLVEVADWKALKAAVAAFPATVPFQPLGLSRRYSTVIEVQEDFAEQRYEDWSTSVERWTVGGEALTDAQALALLNCFEGNCGSYRTFTFTDPIASSSYNAHFVENEAVHVMSLPGVNSLRLTVERLL